MKQIRYLFVTFVVRRHVAQVYLFLKFGGFPSQEIPGAGGGRKNAGTRLESSTCVVVGCRSQLACSAGGWDTFTCYPCDLHRELQDMLVNGFNATLTVRPFEVRDAI